MLNQENKNLIIAYALAAGIVAVLVVVIMNFNTWFFPDKAVDLTQFTPASRGLVGQEDLELGLFNDSKFRSLGPLLTPAELQELQTQEQPTPEPGPDGTVTGTVKPPVVTREVRHGNPFLPF